MSALSPGLSGSGKYTATIPRIIASKAAAVRARGPGGRPYDVDGISMPARDMCAARHLRRERPRRKTRGGGAHAARRSAPDPPRQQFDAARDAEVPVERFHVVVQGVVTDAHVGGDLLFALAGEQLLERLELPRGQAARLGGQVAELGAV